MILFLDGATAMAAFIGGLFFLRFWRQTGDRFFLVFGLGLWMWAVEWTFRALAPAASRDVPYAFLIRLGGFLAILAGILQKNRRTR